MNERRQRLESVFHTAMEFGTAGERERYLAEACAGDPELRREVDELLKLAVSAEAFFQIRGPADSVSETAHSAFLVERVGDRIGRYKLLQKIGEGGCGVVYMAEQEEPVRRKVALKVIKLGMDTRQVVARFEAERQALALMDHPHIAKVFDAGVVGEAEARDPASAGNQGSRAPQGDSWKAGVTGRPYFVMELVRGVKITDYCDENQLSTKDRLDLLIRVCQAVQHAHQKGIIHRDIKPSNILVADHDGVPVPKIIDFGIAKATTDQRLTDKTLFTAFEQFIGTPAYMSPEQARLSGLDIDTRTDIYSLGVLLYELLTGTTPFDTKQLMQSGFDEMRRVIREEAPVRPSTRLHQTAAAVKPGALSKSQIATRKSTIDPDLDWIVLKCLEKDRNRRYETANGLAADLQRHLNHEPVVARPPSRLYEFQKTVRRHRVGFAATAAVLVALAAGLAASLWQARKSEREAAKARTISGFLQAMLGSANPDQGKGTDYTVRQLLDDISNGITNQLENQPEVEADLRDTIGRAYRDLGAGAKAQTHIERALALRRQLFGSEHEIVGMTLINYAWSLFEQSDWQGTEREARRAFQIFQKLRSDTGRVLEVNLVLHKALCAMSRFDEAERVARDALALSQNTPGRKFREVPMLMHGMAEACNTQGKYVEAETLAAEALPMHRRFLGDDHIQVGWALLCLGMAQHGQTKFGEAEKSFRESLRIFRKHYREGHKSVSGARSNLKAVIRAMGETARLQELMREELSEATARIEHNGADVEAWLQRATARSELGLWNEAIEDLDEAISVSRRASPDGQLLVGQGCMGIAWKANEALRHDVALDAARRANGVFQSLTKGHPNRIDFRHSLGTSHRVVGDALVGTGQFESALGQYRSAADLFVALLKEAPEMSGIRDELGATLWQLGAASERLGRFDEAVGQYRQALQTEPQGKEIKGWQALVRIGLAALLAQLGGRPEAEGLLGEITQRGDMNALNELAWYLSTHAEAGERDGPRAVVCAERAVVATNRKIATYLDTLAAAYARAGRFADAVQTEREAIRLLQEPKLLQEFQVALNFYLSNQAFVDHRSLGIRADSLLAAGRFAQAEPLARECLKVRETPLGDGWIRFDTQRILGTALLGQQKYKESEPLLLSAHEGLKGLETTLPPQGRISLKQTSQSLVKLYEATGRPDEAVKWNQRLGEQAQQAR